MFTICIGTLDDGLTCSIEDVEANHVGCGKIRMKASLGDREVTEIRCENCSELINLSLEGRAEVIRFAIRGGETVDLSEYVKGPGSTTCKLQICGAMS